MTFTVVCLLCLVGTSPWWAASRVARRRAGDLGRSVVAPEGATGQVPGAAVTGGRVDVPVLLELVAAAVRSGAAVPRALEAVGGAVGGVDGRTLHVVASGLRLGADWDAAWAAAPPPARSSAPLDPLRQALRGAWHDGAAPGEALRAAGQEVLHERRTSARTAAARLGVRLVLPLGVCYLPAFILLGLTPVLLALGTDLLSG
ncbi:type II secretion system F family protein [Isoptericola jiangsuensis]|uniref:type II secretion system F family protein n=1 Tax=Isoptericola jiangsuensis TaxID=548579 RepID=UPI003AB0ECD3